MKKKVQFNSKTWYQNLVEIAFLPPRQRYDALVELHALTLEDYLRRLTAMSNKQAYEASSDGRTKAIVVAHIMGWEEWQIQVFSDPNRGERLGKQIKLQGYYDDEKDAHVDFKGVDEFNTYQGQRYASWQWTDIRDKAIDIAEKLRSFFLEQPAEEWINFLENTPVRRWQLTPEHVLTIPAGWYLWMVSLKHEAVEHRKDLETG